jgi:hypothetical protein
MDKLATMDTIGSSFRPWLSCQGICLLNRHQTGDTDSVQPIIFLPVQRDSQETFIPCAARMLWYSADRTSSQQLRDTTKRQTSLAKHSVLGSSHGRIGHVIILLPLMLDRALRKGYGRTWEGMARSLRSVSGRSDRGGKAVEHSGCREGIAWQAHTARHVRTLLDSIGICIFPIPAVPVTQG